MEKNKLRKADLISLHAPLFPNTRHIVNEESISLMKESAMQAIAVVTMENARNYSEGKPFGDAQVC